MNMEGDKASGHSCKAFFQEGSCDNILYIHVKSPIKYQNNFDDVQFCVNNINQMLTKMNINSDQMMEHLKADTVVWFDYCNEGKQ